MRVCMIVYKAPPLYGGAGRQAIQLAAHLRRRGIAVTLLAARERADLSPAEIVDGVPVVRLPVFGFGGMRPLAFILGVSWHLLRHGRQFDVFHVHGAYLRLVPIVALARLLGKAVVVKMTLQGSDDPASSAKRRLGLLLRWALGRVDAVVSVSSDMTNAFRETGLAEGRLVEIPNGVMTDTFRPASPDERERIRARMGIPQDAEVAAFVGIVGRRKGADTLLHAWESVIERRPRALLLLVGPQSEDGPEDAPSMELLVSAAARSLALGQIENAAECLQISDVFVLPSRSEGLSNALLEAMSTGLPCIASTIGGMGDVIEDGENGLLVPAGDTRRLADSIVRLFEDPEKRSACGRRARMTIVDGYSLDVVTGKYAELYERILAGRLERSAGE